MTYEEEIEPEILLPVQQAGPRIDVPERRLMLAVLEDALDVFRKHVRTGHGSDLFADVEAWFASDDSGLPFAFVNVCDALGIDAGWLRARLARRRAERRDLHVDGVLVVRLRSAAGSRHTVAASLRRSA